MQRRTFIKLASAGITGAVGAGTASAGPETDRSGGPIEVTGVRLHQFDPQGELVEYAEQFKSGQLRPKFGKETVTVDEVTVSRKYLPAEYQDRQERFTIAQPDTATLGYMSEFEAMEAALQAEVGTQALSVPLYCYKSSEATEKSGPINVCWNVGLSASEIRSAMRNDVSWWAGECWCADLPSHTRYAVIDGSATPHDSEAAKSVGSHLTGSQWHVRAWNLPNGRVIGQAHYDVQDHGQVVLDPDFRFKEARQTVAGTWTDALDYSDYVYDQDNGSGYECEDSSEGKLSYIY